MQTEEESPINEQTTVRDPAELNGHDPATDPHDLQVAAELHTTPQDVADAEAEAPAMAGTVEQIAEDQSWLLHRLRDPRTLLSFGLAIALLAFIFTRFDLDPAEVWQTIQHANLGYFAVGFGVYYLAFLLRGLRWQTLLANVGFSKDRNAGMPGVGGLIEIIYTIGTILAERMIDLFILFGLLLLSGFLTLQGHLPGMMTGVLALGGALIVVLAAGLVALRVFSDRLLGIIPPRFREIFTSFQHGTLQSFRRSSLPVLAGYTAIIWLMEGARLFFVVQSLDQGHLVSLPVVIFIALASSLLTTLPFTPGGIGLVEGAVVGVLQLFGVGSATAISIALLDRLINYWSIVIGGIIVYLISRRK